MLTRTGDTEKRNLTPAGRFRRICYDYRTSAIAISLLVIVAVGVFTFTVDRTLQVRLERDLAVMTYKNDIAAMNFVKRREKTLTHRVSTRLEELDKQVGSLSSSTSAILVVSLAEKKVVYLKGDDTLFSAPVAVGSGKSVVLGGVTKRFTTPRGKMSITHKELNPIWVPPSWHYHEIAQKRGLRIVDMSNSAVHSLASFPPGREPIANGTVYIPPWGSLQRQHKGVLGVAKLEMFDGYYFHGTENESSIGTAASHGCIRLLKKDILWMYENVPLGTQVYIY